MFENVAPSSGIEWNGELGTISVAWLDFNGDSLLDIWTAPHGFNSRVFERQPKLYLNQGDLTFKEISGAVFSSSFNGDNHGSAWIDFDNDGDSDLFITNGGRAGTGEGPNKFFINEEGILTDRAAELNIDFGLGRGRTTLWFDGNRDGLLDIVQINDARTDGQASSTFWQQTDRGFINGNDLVGFEVARGAVTAQVADLFGDSTQDLLIFSDETSSLKVYDTSTSIWNDITARFPEIDRVRDAAIADFNGDGIRDIFLTRVDEAIAQVNSNFAATEKTAFARLITRKNTPQAGIRWQTTGDITFNNSTSWRIKSWEGSEISKEQIFLGSQGINPATSEFTLSIDDSIVEGLFSLTDNSPPGLYIGYDSLNGTWEAVSYKTSYSSKNLLIESSEPLINVTPVGFTQPDIGNLGGLSPVLLVYDPETGEYIDRTEIAGLQDPTSSRSVVSGDFDNDGDVDLYLESSTAYYSLPSILYDNQGDGTFLALDNAGEAAIEFLGTRDEDFNIGINIATGDYDLDGFLDLFAGSSTVGRENNTYSLGTPYYLFRNQGNENNWLQIDLEGVRSNRDGIGTKVFATAGGTTQLRENSGGMHRIGQNQPWLHFGLGANELVDLLRIEWISGSIQELSDITPNQLLKIVENRGTSSSDWLIGSRKPDSIDGLSGDDNLEGKNGNDTLYGGLGRDTIYGDSGNDILYGSFDPELSNNGLGENSISTESLVMHLPLDTETERITPDNSPFGSDNQGYLVNGASIDPAMETSVFDGIDDYIEIENSPDLNLDLHARRTIALQFKVDELDRRQILWEEGGAAGGLSIYLDEGRLYTGIWDGSQSTYLSTDEVRSDTWHQVTVVLNTEVGNNTPQIGAFQGYLDGVKFDEGVAKQLKPHSFYMGIGGLNGGTKFHDNLASIGFGDYGFAGSIDEFYAYNRALSAEEIARLAGIVGEKSLGENKDLVDGRNSIYGNDGNDIIYPGENGDLLKGGLGADQFWIARDGELPIATHKIIDFEVEADSLGIDGLGISFEDLTITRINDDALISLSDTDLALLTGIQVSELNSDSFIFT